MAHNKYTILLGYLIMIAGFVFLIFAAGQLMLQILGAIIALMIINYGIRLTGGGSMQSIAMRAWFSRMR
jgi:hypothetical protein